MLCSGNNWLLTLSVLALVLSVAGASTLQAALFGTRLPWQAQLSGFLVEGHIALQFRWPEGIRPAVQQVFPGSAVGLLVRACCKSDVQIMVLWY